MMMMVMMMMIITIIDQSSILSSQVAVCLSAVTAALGDCMAPVPAANFTMDRYRGLWYEVGKIQTAGGAYFEKDCVCTSIDIQPVPGSTNGDATAINSCRSLTPTGRFLNATGKPLEEYLKEYHWKNIRKTDDRTYRHRFIYISICSSIYLFVCSFIDSFVYCLFIRVFIHSFIYLCIHSSVKKVEWKCSWWIWA